MTDYLETTVDKFIFRVATGRYYSDEGLGANLCLLAVFAHPDDETFRPGGALALLARSGVQVHVLTATRGQAGSCGVPPLCRPDELPVVREYELRCACKMLGLCEPRLLDFQDGKLAEENPDRMD